MFISFVTTHFVSVEHRLRRHSHRKQQRMRHSLRHIPRSERRLIVKYQILRRLSFVFEERIRLHKGDSERFPIVTLQNDQIRHWQVTHRQETFLQVDESAVKPLVVDQFEVPSVEQTEPRVD